MIINKSHLHAYICIHNDTDCITNIVCMQEFQAPGFGRGTQARALENRPHLYMLVAVCHRLSIMWNSMFTICVCMYIYIYMYIYIEREISLSM